MSFALAVTTVLFSAADPQGDALGDGAYQLPVAAQTQASSLDLRTFTAYNNDGKLGFRLGFAALTNSQGGPNGFSLPHIQVFVAERRGGEEALGSSGFRTQTGRGWQYHLTATGWFAKLECQSSISVSVTANSADCPQTVRIRTEGADIVLETDLPVKAYAYWAVVGLYDPLAVDGLRQPVLQASPFALSSSIPDAPAALEVLSKNSQLALWPSREVPALGEVVVQTNPLLWTGLVGLCLTVLGVVLNLFRKR
jgi:C-terminal binding-module, SLH-like, of glucodextranase